MNINQSFPSSFEQTRCEGVIRSSSPMLRYAPIPAYCPRRPTSTQDRFVFPAEVFAHMPEFRMFPQYIMASLPHALEGKIPESEWEQWMSILISDRESKACGDTELCLLLSCLSGVGIVYTCMRPVQRSRWMKTYIDRINCELFEPRGMWLKEQEGYVLGVPQSQTGGLKFAWFSIALNSAESKKLKSEPKRVPLSL